MTTSAIVPPNNGRFETLCVAVVFLSVTIASAAWGLTRDEQSGPPQLLQWQVSAFDGLGADDQAIHSALRVASSDITYWNYDLNKWPTPDELAEILLPPFYEDAFWSEHGSVDWQLHVSASAEHGGATIYTGSGGTMPDQSGYLLVFQHRHVGTGFADQAEVWINKDTKAPTPEGFKAESLVKAGWRQVVTYSGADEHARMKGSD